MKLLRSFVIVTAAALTLAATADLAQAGPPCIGCGHSGIGGSSKPAPSRTSLFGGSHKTQLPAFQAAPWYLYWPYDAHFQTPAPVTGAFYGPALTGNFPVNPYFPGAQGYGGPPLPIPQPMMPPR